MARVIAISGASGKTGFRIAEEVLAAGDQPRLLLRPGSVLPSSLAACEQHRLSLATMTPSMAPCAVPMPW
jgi:NAD(P)-dependent dehydrogenase (short-subunit alcohol dehydrogenase family)